MDPDAALERLRELADSANSNSDPDVMGAVLDEMCEVFAGLDGWLSQGGYRPKAWQT